MYIFDVDFLAIQMIIIYKYIKRCEVYMFLDALY